METYTVNDMTLYCEKQTSCEKVCRWNQPQTGTSTSPDPVLGSCWLKGEDCGSNTFQRETLLLAFGWHLLNVSVNRQFQRFPVTLLQSQQRGVQKRFSHRQWAPQTILSLNTKVLRSGKVTVERQFCSVHIFRSLHFSYNSHKDTLASYLSVKEEH